MRLAEMLRTYSSESEIVVMTLPLPRKGHTNPALYMVKYLFHTTNSKISSKDKFTLPFSHMTFFSQAWLDLMTKNLPPTLLIRGNQEPVLTFYS